MGLERVNGLKGAWKERKKKKKQTMGSIWCEKVRMGHGRPKVMEARK